MTKADIRKIRSWAFAMMNCREFGKYLRNATDEEIRWAAQDWMKAKTDILRLSNALLKSQEKGQSHV